MTSIAQLDSSWKMIFKPISPEQVEVNFNVLFQWKNVRTSK